MSKPQVCMFCRYRRRRALELEACCAAAELAQPVKNAGEQPMQGTGRGILNRLRAPPPPQYRPR